LEVYIPKRRLPLILILVWNSNGTFSILLLTITTGMAVPLSTVPAASWWSIAYLVIIGSIISFIAYIYMLQNYHQKLIVMLTSTQLLLLLGAVIFGETLTIAIGIGGLITLSGLYMVNHSIKKNKRILAGNKV
jgi:drug/metabolite transporter (DMT)-like permease